MKKIGEYLVTDKEAEKIESGEWKLFESKKYIPGTVIKIRKEKGLWRYKGDTEACVLFRYYTWRERDNVKFFRTRVKVLDGDWEGTRISLSN